MISARRLTLGAAAVAGAVVGVVATMAIGEPSAPGTASELEANPDPTSSSTIPGTTTTTLPATETLLVWTSGGLPSGFAERVGGLEGVDHLTMVRGDEIALTGSHNASGAAVDAVEPGWHIPVDALGIEPATFARFAPEADAPMIGELRPGDVLLTETSARLRRLDVGDVLELRGGRVRIGGIIDDETGAGAEVLLGLSDAAQVGVTTDRYVLIAHRGDRAALQRSIAAGLDARPVRFRTPAETAWLRHGDAVAPAAVVKDAFGEFAVRDGPGRSIDVDPAWVARSIVTRDVPILGSVTCHRAVVDRLDRALTELERASLGHLVDPADYAGCFSPRRISEGQPVSHHAWGIALDLNVDGNPRGSFSTQDPRLVEAMDRHGFTWGGTWLVPDPAHYESLASTGGG